MFNRNNIRNKIFLNEIEKNNETLIKTLKIVVKNINNRIYPIFIHFKLEKHSIRNSMNSLLQINKRLSETLPLIKKEKLKMKEEKKRKRKYFLYSQNRNFTPKISKIKKN